VDAEVTDFDLGVPAVAVDRGGRRRRAPLPDGARRGARAVRGIDPHLVVAGQRSVRRDDLAAMEDPDRVVPADDVDEAADEWERDGVPIGVDGDEVIGGDDAAPRGLELEARSARDPDEMLALAGKAIDRPLVRGTVDTDVRDGRRPLGELVLE